MTLIPTSVPLDLIPSIAAVAAACVYQGAHPTLEACNTSWSIV